MGGRWQLVWKPPMQTFIASVLYNPIYAGAYVYGCRRTEVVMIEGQVVRRNGSNFMRDESVTAVRAGHGLQFGLLRCARCGRKLHTRWGKSGSAAVQNADSGADPDNAQKTAIVHGCNLLAASS